MNGPFYLGLIFLWGRGKCFAALWWVDVLWGAKLHCSFDANRIIYRVTPDPFFPSSCSCWAFWICFSSIVQMIFSDRQHRKCRIEEKRIKKSDNMQRGTEGRRREAALVIYCPRAVICLQQWPQVGYGGAEKQNGNRILLLHTFHCPDICRTGMDWDGCFLGFFLQCLLDLSFGVH